MGWTMKCWQLHFLSLSIQGLGPVLSLTVWTSHWPCTISVLGAKLVRGADGAEIQTNKQTGLLADSPACHPQNYHAPKHYEEWLRNPTSRRKVVLIGIMLYASTGFTVSLVLKRLQKEDMWPLALQNFWTNYCKWFQVFGKTRCSKKEDYTNYTPYCFTASLSVKRELKAITTTPGISFNETMPLCKSCMLGHVAVQCTPRSKLGKSLQLQGPGIWRGFHCLL